MELDIQEGRKYRIFDTHAHIFPDKLAEKAVESIGRYYRIPMYGRGTVGGLLENGAKAGVSRYIVHSSATTLEQVKPINDYVSDVAAANSSFIGFGTLHRDLPDPGEEVDRIISMGLKGIKLHPEFQGFTIDDDRMLPVYRAVEGRLPVLIHLGDEKKDSSSPSRLARILDMFPRLVVIGAHFGGYRMWDEACEYLIGRNLYLDTSSSLFVLEPGRAVEMIRKHGARKMVFGSDYPMWDHEEELARFLRLELTEEERKAILYDNADRLVKGVLAW